MTEDFNQFENQLRQLRPRELSPDVSNRIQTGLAMTPTTLADRCLAFTLGCGAIAACLIVGMLTFNVIQSTQLPSSTSLPPVAASATIRDYEQFLARSNDVLPENFR